MLKKLQILRIVKKKMLKTFFIFWLLFEILIVNRYFWQIFAWKWLTVQGREWHFVRFRRLDADRWCLCAPFRPKRGSPFVCLPWPRPFVTSPSVSFWWTWPHTHAPYFFPTLDKQSQIDHWNQNKDPIRYTVRG